MQAVEGQSSCRCAINVELVIPHIQCPAKHRLISEISRGAAGNAGIEIVDIPLPGGIVLLEIIVQKRVGERGLFGGIIGKKKVYAHGVGYFIRSLFAGALRRLPGAGRYRDIPNRRALGLHGSVAAGSQENRCRKYPEPLHRIELKMESQVSKKSGKPFAEYLCAIHPYGKFNFFALIKIKNPIDKCHYSVCMRRVLLMIRKSF